MTPATPPSSTSNERRDNIGSAQVQTRDSVWTHFSTQLRPRQLPPFPLVKDGSTLRLQRSLSQSSVNSHFNKEVLESGAVKIVIDRADPVTNSENEPGTSFPTIEVPIPHYRLGTPRFSARGTAFLHSSVYTRSSINEDLGSSVFSGAEYDRLFPSPLGIEPRQTLSRRHSHASPQAYTMQSDPTYNGPATSVNASRILYESKVPIVSQIYDALAANPDDPSVVKYSPTTKEIVAGSPARIVAQVTSENFLDYELLSDFFLTVRSYLSTQDLLSYLVARFEWAINRFDDNGRVIRVRAFAALRHWILNYFSYDFVMDRDLRVEFCDRLNALTKIVRARANYGASDMKLIFDLKKCWNGRCILYWDSPMASSDAQKDGDIQPGGIVWSQDSQLSHPSQLVQKYIVVDPRQASTSQGEATVHGHQRQSSGATTRSLPISPSSEFSAPVLSCSFATKGFKRANPYANRALGIHPVSTNPDGRRVCPAAPSAQANEKSNRPANAHRRSGSFSDAARDRREPLSSDRTADFEEYTPVAHSYAGSLIRGNAVPPAEPYVSIFAPTTPVVELPDINLAHENGIYGGRKLSAPNNPGVKNLIGNIRRALSSKNSSSNQNSNYGGSAVSSPSLPVAKSAAVPMNIVYQSASVGHFDSIQPNARVDLLALDISEAFNQAMMSQYGDMQRYSSIGIAYGNEREQPSPDERESFASVATPVGNLAPPEMRRMDSGISNGSKSILIGDDTGLNVPEIPPIPQILPRAVESHGFVTMNYRTMPPLPIGYTDPQARSDPNKESMDQVILDAGLPLNRHRLHDPPHQECQNNTTGLPEVSSPDKHETSRPSIGNRGQSFKSTKSGSISLRRYASFQSTFTRHTPKRSVDATTTETSFADPINTQPIGPAVHVLRRRPGGDLRANQNVQDLTGITRPRSTGSIAYSDSMRDSELFNSHDRLARTRTSRFSSHATQTSLAESIVTEVKKSPSFVRTHSSQPAQRRPSFEAAVAEFAQIPDDDEGGIEATLLKLEGKYQKSPLGSPIPPSNIDGMASMELIPTARHIEASQEPAHTEGHTQQLDDNESVVTLSSLPNADFHESNHTTTVREQQSIPLEGSRPMIASTLYAESEESYNSMPLLERITDRNNESQKVYTSQHDFYKSHLSPSDAALDSQSMRRLKHGSSAPTVTTDSFLLDEDDDFLSDLSSELSLDSHDRAQAEDGWQQSQTHSTKENTMLVGDHPPSPPMTMENALSISSQANQAHEQRKPPTPDPSPMSPYIEPTVPNGLSAASQQITKLPADIFLNSRHMPFVLGYDSEILAQQFTIVEKDALNEIDWRDLVDMRWQNSSPSVINWVEYLRTQDPQGIDLVTARFNIMVKWALSEIVLTQNIEERALAITKYIHVAQQARKIHNYATLLQLTIALTSTDCTRLNNTWDLVGAAEKKILQELEDLVTPRRNFYNLRQEMEKANTEEGCIPVVGRFRVTHAILCSC